MGLLSPELLQAIGLIVGAAGLIISVVDLKLVIGTNWNIFTSRLFLRRDETMQTLTYATYLVLTALISITISHALHLWNTLPILADTLQVVTTASLALLVLTTYFLKRSLSETSASHTA